MSEDLTKTIRVAYEDGHSEELTVVPLKVALFSRAWKYTEDNFDELRLLDLVYNQPEGWSQKLKPSSYTEATEAMYAVCRDFFGSVARRQAWRAAMAGQT